MTTTTYTVSIPQTRNQIIERLFKEGHISFDEMLILLEKEKEYVYTTPPKPWDWNQPLLWQNPVMYSQNPNSSAQYNNANQPT